MDPATVLGSIVVCTVLSVAFGLFKDKKKTSPLRTPFKSTKSLAVKDSLVLAMLDDAVDDEMRPCYVITDPDLDDNPIIYSSEAFCSFTQYLKSEVEGRNRVCTSHLSITAVLFLIILADQYHLYSLVDTGRNCRFLQGSKTEPADVKKIRDAVHSKSEVSACLLNYKKDGSTFVNQVRGYNSLTSCNS